MSDFKNSLTKIADLITTAIENEAAAYGLAGSNALKQTTVNVRDNIIVITAPEYVQYIQSGRKAGALKGVRIPINVLLNWLKSKGIRGGVTRAWAIQQSIFNNGIKTSTPPRPFINEALNNLNPNDVIIIDLRELLNKSFGL
jgi:hypothetical protein